MLPMKARNLRQCGDFGMIRHGYFLLISSLPSFSL